MSKKSTAEVIPLSNKLPRKKWVDRIAAAWREQLSSIFETGNLLESAKAELPHGEWIKMIKEELPFGRSMANKLIKISNDDRLRNAEHVPHLPVTWSTLHELTKLTNEQFRAGIKSRAINPKMQRKDVDILRGKEPKKKEIDPIIPKNPTDWFGHLSVEITSAVATLSNTDAAELLDGLRQVISSLEKEITHV